MARGKPSGHVFTTARVRAHRRRPTRRSTRWTHLAIDLGRTTLRLFVNGVAGRAPARSPARSRTSTGVLRIGGNAVWSEWFRGAIDEVRVYNRALTLPEIQGDMGRPVPPPADADSGPRANRSG